jgi:hypothetical protein
MKKDKIEKFIFENKDELNNLKAPRHLWENIEMKMDNPVKNEKGGRIISFNLLNVAVVSIGILICGVLIGRIYFSKSTLSLDPKVTESIEKAEAFYGSLIDYKLQEAKQSNLIDSKLSSHLQELDNEYEIIKERMISDKNINNDLLLNQMVKNYKLRLSLIEMLLEKSNTKNTQQFNLIKKDTI